MVKLKFDHTYNVDLKHKFHKKLEKLGFQLSSQEVEHPGKHYCRFIQFQSDLKRLPTYLEFIDVKNGGEPIHQSGFSMRYLGNIKNLFKTVNSKLKPKLIHRNYNWRENNRKRLPGWNFLSFAKPGYRGIYTWVTEYEPRPIKNENLKNKPTIHPNGVKDIIGIELELNKNGKYFFENLLKCKLKKEIKLSEGHILFIKTSKKNRIKSIILNAKSISTMAKKYKIKNQIIWNNRNALVIKNPNLSWDLIIIEK